MENITIRGEELEQLIKNSIPIILKEKFTATYSNPLGEAISSVLKEQDGVLKDFVRGIIADMLTNDDLKKKISNEVVLAIVQKGLRS